MGAEPGGGGGGGAAGEVEVRVKALRAAWAARLGGPFEFAEGGNGGGGGGVDRTGGLGADPGGKGGAVGGTGES